MTSVHTEKGATMSDAIVTIVGIIGMVVILISGLRSRQ